jgi:opacity protein-like surface antigen
MKKIILATAAAAAFGLSAAASAADQTCGAGTLCVVAAGTVTDFIQDGFSLQLSTGVSLGYVQDARAVGVGTFHPKGNSGFAGTSAGGQIIECGVVASGVSPVLPTIVASGSGATGC